MSESGEIAVDGLFTFDGIHYHPSEFTRGPWRPDAQHGGPPAALLGAQCESEVRSGEFLAQLSVDLLRPVALTPLRASVERHQVSGRVARVVAELHSDSETVARGTALVLAETALSQPEWEFEEEPATEPPSPDHAVDPPRWASGDVTTYHRNAVEHRFTEGSFRTPGPAVDWMRLRLPVIAGQQPTGLQRVAAASDFGSGISAVYGPKSKVGLINANLTIAFVRAHQGEWVSVDSITHVGPQGTGLGLSRLGDADGLVAIATQSLLGYSINR